MAMTTNDLPALVARTRGLQPWRRVFHAANGVVLAFGPPALNLSPGATALLLGLGACALLAGDLIRLRVPRLNRTFFRLFRPLASPREEHHLASSTWYAVGAFLAWWWFPPIVATASILVLGLADPAASVVGRLVGRRPLGKGTVEGSLTFMVVAFLALWPLVGPGAAAVGAVLTGLAEVAPLGLDDNLVIPLVCGGVLWAVGSM
jgi:dolichol kinase